MNPRRERARRQKQELSNMFLLIALWFWFMYPRVLYLSPAQILKCISMSRLLSVRRRIHPRHFNSSQISCPTLPLLMGAHAGFIGKGCVDCLYRGPEPSNQHYSDPPLSFFLSLPFLCANHSPHAVWFMTDLHLSTHFFPPGCLRSCPDSSSSLFFFLAQTRDLFLLSRSVQTAGFLLHATSRRSSFIAVMTSWSWLEAACCWLFVPALFTSGQPVGWRLIPSVSAPRVGGCTDKFRPRLEGIFQHHGL